MDYQATITVPANTPATSPQEDTLEIAPGIINLVYIKGRRGAANLLHCRIFWGEHRLYPTSPDEWYNIDWFPIQFRDWVLIYDVPYELTIESYNEDEVFQHTYTLRVNIWPLEFLGTPLTLPERVPSPWPELPTED